MRATFLRDGYNRMWLFYVRDIKVRRRVLKGRAFNPRVDYFQTVNLDTFTKQTTMDL